MQYNTTLFAVRNPSDKKQCNAEKQISPEVVSQEHVKYQAAIYFPSHSCSTLDT
jgi:hypothetical protein